MLMSGKRIVCMLQVDHAQGAQASPGMAGAEELIEPTLVLPFPVQPVSATESAQHAASSADASVKALRGTPLEALSHQPAQSPACTAQLGHLAAHACHLTGSPKRQGSATQAGQTESASMAPVVGPVTAPVADPYIAATGSCKADVPVQCQRGSMSAGSAQPSNIDLPSAAVKTAPEIPVTVQQCQHSHQEQAVAQPQLDGPLQQAGTCRQPTPARQDGSVGGQAGVAQEDSNRQNSDERAARPEGEIRSVNEQGGSTEGQSKGSSRQTGKLDGAAQIADGQDGGFKRQAAIAVSQPAVQDDTVSEACCVCKFAEDGEVMLLCDKCDLPAHLGCVGLEAVPEGDWFCPNCATSVMVRSFCC